MSEKKINERDWWLYELFMLMLHPEQCEWIDHHVCRLADAYANPRDFIKVLKEGKPHPAFTGVQQGYVDPKFIEQWERFINQAPYGRIFELYEEAVADEERERIERLQEAQRVIKNEGRLGGSEMIQSSSPVAHVALKTNGQWMVVTGHAFDGGLFLIGPFSTKAKADMWFEEHGGGTIVPCLDPNSTIVDRCGYPLHEKDSFRS